MGGVVGKNESPKAAMSETKLEARINEAIRRREVEGSTIKSFNSIILKFPKIDRSLRKCKATFEDLSANPHKKHRNAYCPDYNKISLLCLIDEDGNGAIDRGELKRCFHKLEISFTDEEVNDLFEACDINEDMGMKFNEFIVLLCLVYLLKEDPAAEHAKSRMGMLNLEATFETLVDAFVFLDKNKDGYVSKNEMVDAINETTSGERSSGRIAMKRFEEMDWDKNGMVNFKEFVFAFTRWVGIEEGDDDEGENDV
ncbi:UNVERIFIED_CONTAM: putative calcium-binding protein CML21 [Sesamum angustifolium]|uniref:Calcium-binding protein CML21 n=1 Tax=Sesamum angustifolium TaxID=2727405 RepID=A0AAW2PBF7_9LAMI